MTQNKVPKVFVSHASEDKERFVTEFGTKLRENGVDAWVDHWEIKPGDSLVDKIFEEGIKEADAIIIVLSNTSVQKPWVREELNAGVIRRIAKQTKIIPVVIDDCEVPESLRSTLYQKIANVQDYDDAFRRILSAIYDISEKPPLGSPPPHRQLQIDKMPGLSQIDTTVLKVACEIVLDTGNLFAYGVQFREKLQELDISDEEITDSIQILEDRSLIDVKGSIGDFIPPFMITLHGFENYAKFYLPDFDEVITRTILAILNNNLTTNGAIAKHLGKSPILIEYTLDILASRKYVKVHKFHGDGGENVVVQEVTPQGKRFARQLE